MTALLLGISLTTVVILSDSPKSGATVNVKPPAALAVAPAIPSAKESPVSVAEESDPLAGIRIVDPSWDKKISCNEGTWPYIDQRCLVKDEAKSDASIENKIGPRMIDSRTRPAPAETSGPIGSTTAIAPAAPKVATDGVAPQDLELPQDLKLPQDLELPQDAPQGLELVKDEEKEEPVPQAAPTQRVAPSQLVETRTSPIPAETTPAQSATPRSSRPARYAPTARKRQPVRTFRLSEESQPVVTQQRPAASARRAAPVRRAVSVKRKRQPYVTEAGRRSRQRVMSHAQAPQPPQFFFPFGWFVQAR